MLLGLILVGDYALATGEDRHVAFAASLLAKTSHSLAWVWMLPAGRVQIAAALAEAWQRPHPVACFGGLGEGVDDHVLATVAALQQGRDEVGLPRYALLAKGALIQVGNIALFRGEPTRAHETFAQWWQGVLAAADPPEAACAVENLPWRLPESGSTLLARRHIKTKFPQVGQKVVASPDSGVMLQLTASSRSKVQAARKALQAALLRD